MSTDEILSLGSSVTQCHPVSPSVTQRTHVIINDIVTQNNLVPDIFVESIMTEGIAPSCLTYSSKELKTQCALLDKRYI